MTEVALEHRRSGEGEPLVAIHGIGSCWQVWNPVLPALEERHDVLALSLPGYGQSAPVAGEPTVPALVDAVEEAMDACGWDTAHLVGNSMGGWIAAELAARGRARTMVATSPAGLWTDKEQRYSRTVLRQSYAAAQRLAPHADRITATAAGRRFAFGMTYARPERLDPADAAYAIRAFAGLAELPADARLDRVRAGDAARPALDRVPDPHRLGNPRPAAARTTGGPLGAST